MRGNRRKKIRHKERNKRKPHTESLYTIYIHQIIKWKPLLYGLPLCVCVCLYRYSIWRLTHISLKSRSLALFLVTLLLWARLNIATFTFSLSFTSPMNSACVRVCLCVFVYRKHWTYTPFSDLHLLISRVSSGKHSHTRCSKMLQAISYTTSCVYKFVAKRVHGMLA